MKKGMIIASLALLAAFALPAAASAETTYYYIPSIGQYQQPAAPIYTGGTSLTGGTQLTEAQLIAFLQQLIAQLQAQLAARGGSSYYNPGYYYAPGYNYVVGDPKSGSSKGSSYGDEPEVETDRATSIGASDARLEGNVDMMDFEDGEVFFVYGTDEDQVEDVEDDYDSYRDIDEDGDDLQKVRVDSSFDGEDDFSYRVTGLDDDTDYYFQICVGFEDDDDDERIICGGVEDFTTDRD